MTEKRKKEMIESLAADHWAHHNESIKAHNHVVKTFWQNMKNLRESKNRKYGVGQHAFPSDQKIADHVNNGEWSTLEKHGITPHSEAMLEDSAGMGTKDYINARGGGDAGEEGGSGRYADDVIQQILAEGKLAGLTQEQARERARKQIEDTPNGEIPKRETTDEPLPFSRSTVWRWN